MVASPLMRSESYQVKATSLNKLSNFSKEEENAPKTSKHNENHTIRFNMSENLTAEVSSSYIQKCENLCFSPKARSRMRV